MLKLNNNSRLRLRPLRLVIEGEVEFKSLLTSYSLDKLNPCKGKDIRQGIKFCVDRR